MRYLIYDHKGELVDILRSVQAAEKLAAEINGFYEEEVLESQEAISDYTP